MQKLPYKSIQGNYRQLLGEVRKKETALVASLNDALVAVQTAEKEQPKEIPQTTVELLIKPVEQLLQAKNSRAFQPALSIVQVLSAANLLAFPHKVTFAESAAKLLDVSDDMIPIKVIQILLIMLTKQDVGKYPLANKILALCLKAFASKSQLIKNNIFAVLREMYSLLFERYATDHKASQDDTKEHEQPAFEESEIHKVCAEQIEQLIALAGDKYKYTNFKGLGMDLLTVILAETQGQLSSSPRIAELLEKSYAPFLKNYLANEINSFPLITRAVKSATQLILTLQTSYNLVHPILAISASSHSWHRYLALESFCTLFGEYRQIQLMHGMINNVTNMRLLGDLMNAIVTIAPKLPERTAEDSPARLNLTRGNKVHELSEAVACEPPIPSPSQYLALLCIARRKLISIGETLGNFVENLEELFAAEGIRLGEAAARPLTQRQTEQAADILEYTWKPVHEMLGFVLKTSDSEMQVQQTLHNIQSLINMSGSVGLSAALQNIVSSLCGWQIPADLEEKTWDAGYKHIYVFNAIFNVAQCLNKILDRKAWTYVFDALQRIAACVHKIEGDVPGQEPQTLGFAEIGKWVTENMARYLPKGVSPVRMSKRDSLFSAGVGDVPRAPAREDSKLSKDPSEKEEEPSSPVRMPSMTEEDEKDTHIQKIHSFGIKTATAPAAEHKREDHALPGDVASPLKLVPPDASINFYRLNNSLFSKREDSSPQLGRKKDLTAGNRKSTLRVGNLRGEIECMKSSLESLFVLTTYFDDDTLHEFVAALGEITMAAMEGLAGANPQAKTVEVKDTKKLNLFGLTRMLETVIANAFRVCFLWDYVSSHIEALANSRVVPYRTLAMDAATCIIINIFDSRKTVLFAASIPLWEGDGWQAAILKPMMDAVLSGNVECVRAVLANLRSIIENCGPYMAKEGWEIVLGIVEKLVAGAQKSGGEATERVERAFKCVELIIHNSLHRVHIENLPALSAVIHYFATLRQNLNVSLQAVAFLQNVADYVCQQKLGAEAEEQLNGIWINLLNRLKEIGTDERSELRNAAYRTLEQIMTGHAEVIPIKIWTYMLVDICSQLLQTSKICYLACATGGNYGAGLASSVATPKFTFDPQQEPARNKPKVMKFDEESLKRDAEEQKAREKAWEESNTVLHSTVIRVVRKLYASVEAGVEGSERKERTELVDKAWSLLLETWADLAKHGSYEILSTILKAIQQMAAKCRDCVFRRFEGMWLVIVLTVACLVGNKPDPHVHARPLVVKLAPVVVETLRCIFAPENAKEYSDTLLTEKLQSSLLELLKKLLSATSKAEGSHGMLNPIRLLTEERAVFDFVEYLPTIYTKDESYVAYFAYLVEMLGFRVEDPHSDAFIRQTLCIVKNFIVVRMMPLGLVKRLVPVVYPRFAGIISLRFQNDACKTLLFNAKDSQPLWYDVGELFVQISTYLVNPQMFKETYTPPKLSPEKDQQQQQQEDASSEEQKDSAAALSTALASPEFETRKTAILADKELQDLAWGQIIKLIKEMLRVPDGALNSLDRALAEEVIKKSQDLDVALVNFILRVLLPSSAGLSKESQQELVSLIDNGCTAFYSTFGASSSSQARAGDTLSKFCISTLISLCSSVEPKDQSISISNFAEIKQKIAAITTPVLINRCKAIFHKYMADEKRSGQVPLPSLDRQRSADMIDLLEKLKQTTIFTNALPKREGGIADLLAGSRAHLIYLMPEIVECISSREADLRDAIKDVLQQINKMLLGELAELKKLPGEI